MRIEPEYLLRYLHGELSDAEAAGLRDRLARDAELRRRLERVRALRHTLQTTKPDSFAPFFSERVLRRLKPASESLYLSLRWAFARTAVAGLAAAGALGAYNLFYYQGLGVATSLVETLFGLPSASLSDALSYGAF